MIAGVCVCDQKGVRQADMLLQELDNPLAGQIRGHLGDNRPAPFNRPDDGRFLGAPAWLVRFVVVLLVRAPGASRPT